MLGISVGERLLDGLLVFVGVIDGHTLALGNLEELGCNEGTKVDDGSLLKEKEGPIVGK